MKVYLIFIYKKDLKCYNIDKEKGEHKIMNINPLLMTDFYKVVHKQSYVENLEYLTSYWTPRKSRVVGVSEVVAFGFQGIFQEVLVENFKVNFFDKKLEDLLKEYERTITFTMGNQNGLLEHGKQSIKELHNLGYLPIKISAVDEGTLVPIGVPMFSITNTVKGFGWLVNYLETYISSNIWLPITSATTAFKYKKIATKYFNETSNNIHLIPYALGDFSMRGMTSFDTAIHSSAGHLTSFVPTATIPSILWMEKYYNENIEKYAIGKGSASMEHSVMSSYGKENEYASYEHLITEVFPEGSLSIVSDTYDYFNVITNYLPKLKEQILSRNGTILIRGDSGDPVDIIAGYKHTKMTSSEFDELCKKYETNGFRGCDTKGIIVLTDAKQVYQITGVGTDYYWGEVTNAYYEDENGKPLTYEEVLGTVELLWEIFGGHINQKGYKVLDSHIKAIYGDSITPERAEEIYARLKAKGFSVENVVLGIGSYTYQYVTRDTYGFALKATHAIIDGKEQFIYKDPKTDKSAGNNFKKSHKGLVAVIKDDSGKLIYVDELSVKEKEVMKDKDLLTPLFENGQLVKHTTLQEIRSKLESQL